MAASALYMLDLQVLSQMMCCELAPHPRSIHTHIPGMDQGSGSAQHLDGGEYSLAPQLAQRMSVTKRHEYTLPP